MATLDNPTDTSGRLIAGNQVSGTVVYNPAGERLGTINDVMIDKLSGKIAYAILSFGGFLGIGDKHHPLPWAALKYDTKVRGYVVSLDQAALEGAPSFTASEKVNWEDETWGKQVHDFYNAEPYWQAKI
ncbi:MAG: PRC-barrel domain-containing protein [Acetobacteraceae bacterium]|nr:PRC-barrel domain-containing protein [Acetobacteraceae bacterium]MBV8524276.1 PRC-barrel domain-containing protein [Acetobacteraceae bacterium]